MRQQRKVVHVELLKPPPGYKKHYYFGSVAAIYDTLPKEVVGISKETLWNTCRIQEHRGREAIIRQDIVVSKKTDRGKRKEE